MLQDPPVLVLPAQNRSSPATTARVQVLSALPLKPVVAIRPIPGHTLPAQQPAHHLPGKTMSEQLGMQSQLHSLRQPGAQLHLDPEAGYLALHHLYHGVQEPCDSEPLPL